MTTRGRARLVANATLLLAFALVTLGCQSTFQYRAIQSDFIQAVRIDNEASVDPLSASTAEASYASIAADLTNERIGKLDEKLRGNAWVIRGYSEWRAGLYKDAIASAERGTRETVLGPRDQILLELLPALATDSETRSKWLEMGREITGSDDYEDFQTRFKNVYAQIGVAEASVGPSTSPSTKYYVAYHRWRILNNWRMVIASVDKQDPLSTAQANARSQAEAVVGGDLELAADKARDAIPTPHSLRQLIKSQGGG
jgi:hypothetical protein